MGDDVEVGSLIYKVFDVKWLPQLGEGPEARVPTQRFFLVRVSVLNSGSQRISVPPLEAIDSQGNAHLELTDGRNVPLWAGFLREIQPAETLQGNIVFDVTPAHYKLRVTDEAEERVALIDIPLDFQSETPLLPEPGSSSPLDVPLTKPRP